jgi:hypothetical protein
MRIVAQALADPAREAKARAFLQAQFAAAAEPDFKAFLASAPLEGIDLTRNKSTGRNVDKLFD